jgi:xanthine dehydrogenase YagS FAD-binding subunit
MLPSFAYVKARDLTDAVRHLSQQGARAHAGGTDLLGCLRDGVFGADTVVSLSGLEDLCCIREEADGTLRLGALATISEVAAHPLVRERYTALAQAASEVASPQLRNQGTIGGNICQKPRCWYYRGDFHCLRKGGDLCYAVGGQNQFHCILGGESCFIVHPSDPSPALAALGAEAEVHGPDGQRRIPLADFHVPPAEDPMRETRLEPGEVVTALLLPRPERGARSAYRKVRARRAWDFALAGAALHLVMDGETVQKAHIWLSGAAPVPWRAQEAEDALTGATLDAKAMARAEDAAMADARPLAHNAYKIPLFKGLLREELEKLAAG